MKTIQFFLLALISVSIFFSCELTESETTPLPTVKFPADTEEQFFTLMDNSGVKMIRSFDDLKERRNDRNSIYAKLDDDTYKEFKLHLKFKNNALSTAKVDMLKLVLGPEDYVIFWSEFGISDSFLADHEGYECFNPGDCKVAMSHICTSNC